mgnify:CR=1 FL=1
MEAKAFQILLTNDDGIQSPGIWAAAEALAEIGQVWVIAPREQSTSAGRSHPYASDGIVNSVTKAINGREVQGYAVGASPAQVVHYAVREIMPHKPDLVVSGINYGCNTGFDITRSGTIGAALEGANYGIRSLAVSVETTAEMAYSHSDTVDFGVSAVFTARFAQMLLSASFEEDVHVLKVEVPIDATPETPWEIARLSRRSLYLPDIPNREDWSQPHKFAWHMETDLSVFPEGSDTHTVFVKRHVAVTPLSLDLTSRVDLTKFEQRFRED